MSCLWAFSILECLGATLAHVTFQQYTSQLTVQKMEQNKKDDKLEYPDKPDVLHSNKSASCDDESDVAISLKTIVNIEELVH